MNFSTFLGVIVWRWSRFHGLITKLLSLITKWLSSITKLLSLITKWLSLITKWLSRDLRKSQNLMGFQKKAAKIEVQVDFDLISSWDEPLKPYRFYPLFRLLCFLWARVLCGLWPKYTDFLLQREEASFPTKAIRSTGQTEWPCQGKRTFPVLRWCDRGFNGLFRETALEFATCFYIHNTKKRTTSTFLFHNL